MNIEIIIPALPSFPTYSPELVRVLDKIRYEIGKKDNYGDLFEFYWFAREYPRFYRYHIEHAEHRLKQIHEKYQKIRDIEVERVGSADAQPFGFSLSNHLTHEIYWDFEAYLVAINAALDLLARVVGTAYPNQTPISFNKLCKKADLKGIVDILRKAKKHWVDRFKDYRDCFTHYTPADNRVFADILSDKGGLILRCKLPTNPNIRAVDGFRYSKKVEVLRYAISLYRHLSALDKAVGKEIMRLYMQSEYPKRTRNLFFIGQREI